MSRKRTYYDLFGLPFGASEAQIKQRYRELAKRLHPDVNPSPEAQQEMQRLNEAYRVLTTPHLRRAYHLRLLARAARRRVVVVTPPPYPPPMPQNLRSASILLAIPLGLVLLAAALYHWLHPFAFHKLSLRDMNLSDIPPYLHLPASLHTVDLSHNRFTRIPPVLFSLPNLTTLNMAHNRISIVPADIYRMKHLESLNLAYNHISALPLGIGEMQRLRHINLRGNRLSHIPIELLELPNLESLDLRDNPLTASTRDALRRLADKKSMQVLWDDTGKQD